MPIILKTQNISNMYTPIELVTIGGYYFGSGGVTDHGLLHGLLDNDHPQYLLSSNATSITTGAYLHDHGDTPSITGIIGGTIAPNAWSLSIPDFLITAAKSDHTHSDLYVNTSLSNEWQTSVLSNTFITTAAEVSHLHGTGTQIRGTNITIGSSSNELALSVPNFAGTNTSTVSITGSDVAFIYLNIL